MKLKITKTYLRILAVIIAVIVLGVIIFYYLLPIVMPTKLTSWDYHGTPMNFRADLRDADKVIVLPNDAWVRDSFTSQYLKNITIVFKNDSSDLGLVAVEAAELSYKLSTIYMKNGVGIVSQSEAEEGIPDNSIVLSAAPVTDYRNLQGTFTGVLIVLIPPSETNVTSIRASNNAVFISGKNGYEFDMATVKLLMVIMEITSEDLKPYQ
jgi:hypothetical protein